MTEIMAQRDSTGILYEPYHNDFQLCIYEEASVQGKNERYEFRCDTNLACCGRVCCVPESEGLPWWLYLLLALLALLLLLALLSLLYYLCCRKKKKRVEPKKIYRPDLYHGNAGGYRSIKHGDDGSYDDLRGGGGQGYGNRGFDQRAAAIDASPPAVTANTAFAQRHSPRPSSFHEEETFEESFKEEIEPRLITVSLVVPPPFAKVAPSAASPTLDELVLGAAQPLRVEHGELAADDASPASPSVVATPPLQHAQHAVLRPFEADPMQIEKLPAPNRVGIARRDASEWAGAPQRATPAVVHMPEPQSAESVYLRPGFENVPSY